MLWSPRSATREQCTCCSEDLVQPKKKKKGSVLCSHIPREGVHVTRWGGTGDAPGSAVRQKERGAVGEGLYCGFCKKGGAG